MAKVARRPEGKIIDDIVNELHPWRTTQRSEIAATVRLRLNDLRISVRDFFSRSAVIDKREGARGLIAIVDEFKSRLLRAPPELRLHFKLDESSARDDHMTRLFDELNYVREICQRVIDTSVKAGGRARADEAKLWCARVAQSLIYRFSTNEPTSGSPNSRFRRIAGLIYEAVSPEPIRKAPDLKRACDVVLRRIREAVQIVAGKSSDL